MIGLRNMEPNLFHTAYVVYNYFSPPSPPVKQHYKLTFHNGSILNVIPRERFGGTGEKVCVSCVPIDYRIRSRSTWDKLALSIIYL